MKISKSLSRKLVSSLFLCTVASHVVAEAFADDRLTSVSLSEMLRKQCTSFEEATLAPTLPDQSACTADTPTVEQIGACRSAIIDLVVTHGLETLDAADRAVVEAVENDRRAQQRLHSVLLDRRSDLRARLSEVGDYIRGVEPPTDQKLSQWAQDLLTSDQLKEHIRGILREHCVGTGSAVHNAIFPGEPTPKEELSLTEQQIQAVLEESERKYFESFSSAEGFERTVECLWGEIQEGGVMVPRLTCKPALLVSGQDVSEIRIVGVPSTKPVRVVAQLVEEVAQDNPCPTPENREGTRLTCDESIFPARSPRPLVIAVHTMRLVRPTWGGLIGKKGTAVKVLRGENRGYLMSLVTDGASPTVHIGVQAGDDLATASVPIGYARWGVESGGFFAVIPDTNLLDHQIISRADPDDNGKVIVERIDSEDDFGQETGIFVNFIPQNYKTFGVSLGFATSTGNSPSFYFAPINLRITTFGHRGLASLALGVALRDAQRYPGLTERLEKGRIAADSSLLQGKRDLEAGWFVGFNLGIRIGSFGVRTVD